jgi:hypothetical protein
MAAKSLNQDLEEKMQDSKFEVREYSQKNDELNRQV